MKYIVFFSGGKDSQASLIWAARQYGAENITAALMDTAWENPVTYVHVREICEAMKVNVVILKSKKYEGFVDLAKKKKRFPSTKARFCTEELKIKPAIDYMLSQTDHVTAIEGIRASESESRSKMSRECTYFKYYFEPYQTNSLIIESLKGKKELTAKQQKQYRKAADRLALGKEDPKYYTYRKKDVFAWAKQYNADKLRPFFEYSEQQVIDYIIDAGQKPNPLYAMGFRRVGCWPCIMSRHSAIKLIILHHPERWAELKVIENEVGHTIFPPDFIPKRFCSNKRFPTLDDIERYLMVKNHTIDLFHDDTPSCMSVYNHICD